MNRPVTSSSFEGAFTSVVARHQKIAANVIFVEVVDDDTPCFVQQLHAPTVRHDDTGELHAHTTRGVFEVQNVRGTAALEVE